MGLVNQQKENEKQHLEACKASIIIQLPSAS